MHEPLKTFRELGPAKDSPPAPTILIAGLGNIFLGDDAFGSEVARRLEMRTHPRGVRAVDFGIRGLDLAYALLDGHDLTILIDAAPRGSAPGTLYVIEPDLSRLDQMPQSAALVDAHTLDLLKILGLARSMGARWRRLLLVGCEPADLGGDEGRLGMTDVVRVAVDEAVTLVTRLIEEFLQSASERSFDHSLGSAPDSAPTPCGSQPTPHLS
jgi:hydrogenase maturation protease